ncbi:MAG: type IV pilus modification PilV family protein [Thermogutta sp.]
MIALGIALCLIHGPAGPLRSGKRSGFSLLEVLIAMFILTVGMLGIAAVVVIGNSSALRALVADRVASVGRNALAEVRIREMLDARRWINVDGSPVVTDGNSVLPGGEAFCIDPLYISAVIAQTGGGSSLLGRFPYYSAPSLSMRRVSLNIARRPDQLLLTIGNRKLWERIFVAEDDLVFDAAALSRPRLLFRTNTGAAVPFPLVPGEAAAGNQLLYADYQGMYSWMVTVVPQVPGMASGTQKYLVSAVVFRDRSFLWRDDPTAEVPGERVATANFMGGGDLRLSIPDSQVADAAQAEEYLKVLEGQYFLLAGGTQVQKVFLWYRVVAGSEVFHRNQRYYRELTVVGPDWNPAWFLQTNNDTDGDGISLEAQAVLCTNVYGVYTEVVDPDILSRWSVSMQ